MRAVSGVVVLMLVSLATTAMSRATLDADRLDHLLVQDCGSCHGLTLQGGLGRPLTPAALTDWGEEQIALVILEGVPGTAMPPWRSLLTRDEAAYLARRLKQGIAP